MRPRTPVRLRLRTAIDTRPLLAAMLERGVAYMPGEVFFPATVPATGYLRLNFSHATAGQMHEGLRILAGAVKDVRGRPPSVCSTR